MAGLLGWNAKIVYNPSRTCQFRLPLWRASILIRIQIPMKSEDYAQGDAFQSEKRTLFSSEWLPLCADRQIAKPGDFVSATVGGWGVFGVRDKDGTVRVLRNACRHQNMQVVS